MCGGMCVKRVCRERERERRERGERERRERGERERRERRERPFFFPNPPNEERIN